MQNTSDPQTPRSDQSAQDFLTYNQYMYFMMMYAITWTVLPFLGVISNVINIRTFILMGLEDGVTVSFLALSFSDLGFVLVLLIQGLSTGFYVVEWYTGYTIWFAVDPYAIGILCANIGIILYIMTELTTTYLSVARCMCVAKPLHFKNIFTRRIAILIHTGFAAFALSSYVPVLANMGTMRQFDKRVNASRPLLWLSPDREEIKDSLRGLTEMFVPFASQLITIVCVVIMDVSLRKSVKFRQQMSSEASVRVKSDAELSVKLPKGKKDQGDRISGKEVQVVRQVVLISAVYIVCNFPKIILTIAGILEPEFTLGKRYQFTYLICNSFRYNFDVVNSSVNLFIYHKYNSKFRKTCGLPCTELK